MLRRGEIGSAEAKQTRSIGKVVSSEPRQSPRWFICFKGLMACEEQALTTRDCARQEKVFKYPRCFLFMAVNGSGLS